MKGKKGGSPRMQASSTPMKGEMPFKKGGKVHKAEGKKGHKRMDKYARGGKVAGKGGSPFSRAGKENMRPGFAQSTPDKEDD